MARPKRVKLTHPDTGATCEVSLPAVEVLAASGWLPEGDQDTAAARSSGTTDSEPSSDPVSTDEATASDDPPATKATKSTTRP